MVHREEAHHAQDQQRRPQAFHPQTLGAEPRRLGQLSTKDHRKLAENACEQHEGNGASATADNTQCNVWTGD